RRLTAREERQILRYAHNYGNAELYTIVAVALETAMRQGEILNLHWEHINLTGDYVWRQSRRLEDGKFRPLRMPGKP
ncbi:tyrosine-type recombinase/integrase, partial [Klebsiella pneumoniae]|uniref:tyrosine-type recombinase/integrase n=1 Tax=Klebsiella pneumoniae TaxID=573 RepID=UPI0031F32749